MKRGFEAAISAYIASRVPPTFFGAQPSGLEHDLDRTRLAVVRDPEGLDRGIERITVADEQTGKLGAHRKQFGREIDISPILRNGVQARRHNPDLLHCEFDRGQLQTAPVGREQQQAASRTAQPDCAPDPTRAARAFDDEVVFPCDRLRAEVLSRLGLCVMARMQPDFRGEGPPRT